MAMRPKARRILSRLGSRSIRRAGRDLCLRLAVIVAAAPLAAEAGELARDNTISGQFPYWPVEIHSAQFTHPTTDYSHGVLGDAVEWSGLRYSLVGKDQVTSKMDVRLPEDHVFEDLAPRLVDLNLDGHPDAVMVVETDMARGAALALYGADGKIAETPHIGRTNRWLAPIGAGDLDGDGRVELAYIDRPHLAKTMRIWRFDAGKLREVATQQGLTNHRIGDDFITSGLRVCAKGPELVTVDGNWRRLVANQLLDDQIISRDIGAFTGLASLQAALDCQ